MNSNEIVKAEFLKYSCRHTERSIYTDGAKSSEGVGCAFVDNNEVIKKKLPSSFSIFTAETYAILQAVKYIFNVGMYKEKFIIYCDSNSVLLALRQMMSAHPLVQEVQEWLVLLHSRKRIEVGFCWVPGHVGIRGNEIADQAVKEAIAMHNIALVCTPYGDYKQMIHSHVCKKWQDRWDSLAGDLKLKAIRPSVKKWQSSNYPDRRSGIILSRLRIGHTHATHKYLLQSGEGRRVPTCNPCQSDLTVRHILLECPTFLNERRATSLNGRSMSDLLGDYCDVNNIMKFLKKIGFYYEL